MTVPSSIRPTQVRVTGKVSSPDYFRIVERTAFDPQDIVRVMRGEVAGVIFRGLIDAAVCERVRKNFWSNPLLRKRGDAVPAYYLGTYHYGKELAVYFREAAETRPALAQVFEGTDNFYARIMQGVSGTLQKQRVTMRLAECDGYKAGEFVMRSWSGSGSFALSAHDDAAQLTARKQAGFEIQRVAAHPLCAVNLCLENGDGGELVYWNIEPDHATRAALGIEETGYPYAADILGDFARIDLPIHTGDAYFFNGKLVHAVRAQNQPGQYRSTISLLMGFRDPQTVIYWT